MIPRSSIFSFDTLRGPWRLPVGALFALGLLLLAEGAAQWLVHQKLLQVDVSLRQHVTRQLARLRAGRPGIWLLGNSTLAYGIDEARLTELGGLTVAKLTHGSATLRGSAAMLDFYLNRCSAAPAAVVVLLTKDDLNAGGNRAAISREYIRIAATGALPAEESLLALRAARQDIKMQVISLRQHLAHWMGGWRHPETGGAPSPTAAAFSGQPIPRDDPWFNSLAQDYALDTEAFSVLADTCRRHHVRQIAVVLLPVTDVLVNFHNTCCPHIPYRQIRSTVGDLCRAQAIEFLDWGEPSRDYQQFRDPYHLNEDGRRQLTERLARWTASAARAGTASQQAQ